MTDHIQTIRTALRLAGRAWSEQPEFILAQASLAALQEERGRMQAQLGLHTTRDRRIASVVGTLKQLRAAMDAPDAEAHESLLRTLSDGVSCAIVALQTPEMRAAMGEPAAPIIIADLTLNEPDAQEPSA